jgi:hypothetical protein
MCLYEEFEDTKGVIRETRTPLNRGELGCSGSVNNFCSPSGACRVNLVTNPVNEERTGNRLRRVEHIRGNL